MKNISIIQIVIALIVAKLLFKNEIAVLIEKIKSYLASKKDTSSTNNKFRQGTERQEKRDSNPQSRFWKPKFYHQTILFINLVMFYFKEITYRLYFTFFLTIITAILINSYKYLLILVIFLPLVSNDLVINIVYPDPFIIMSIYFELTIVFLVLFITPFIVMDVLDFLKPGLSTNV